MTTIAMRAAGAMVLAAAVALATPASAAPRLRYYPEKAQKANVEGVARHIGPGRGKSSRCDLHRAYRPGLFGAGGRLTGR
jgi:polyisoprenoid-binding protein YceI